MSYGEVTRATLGRGGQKLVDTLLIISQTGAPPCRCTIVFATAVSTDLLTISQKGHISQTGTCLPNARRLCRPAKAPMALLGLRSDEHACPDQKREHRCLYGKHNQGFFSR